jgi:thiol-disulfide isomerase/thioredoxin
MMVYQKFSYNFDAAELDSIYRVLTPSTQHAYFGRKIKAALDIARITAVGKPALDFVQKDVSGTPVSLSSFKGKLLLLDFWASWCGPCRMANPAIVKAYRKYHAKGFDILSVSLDSDKNKWIAAIKKDNLSWTQVSDLKGWQNNVAVLYGIQSIPMSFLLDKEGKIIARGLNAAELEKKLAETLK